MVSYTAIVTAIVAIAQVAAAGPSVVQQASVGSISPCNILFWLDGNFWQHDAKTNQCVHDGALYYGKLDVGAIMKCTPSPANDSIKRSKARRVFDRGGLLTCMVSPFSKVIFS